MSHIMHYSLQNNKSLSDTSSAASEQDMCDAAGGWLALHALMCDASYLSSIGL
jgi:hypothetical protein